MYIKKIIKYTLEALKDINGFDDILSEIQADKELYEEMLDELFHAVLSAQVILEPVPNEPGLYYVKGTRYDL